MATRTRVVFGTPTGFAEVEAQVRAAVVKRAAEAGVKRVQGRLRATGHPSGYAIAAGLSVAGTNQWSATISGSRGGPGIIRPGAVTGRPNHKRALYWPGAAHPVRGVNGKGIGPLVEAEVKRVETIDVSGVRIT